eukprot:455706-Pyramimonas_sp.AAC.1
MALSAEASGALLKQTRANIARACWALPGPRARTDARARSAASSAARAQQLECHDKRHSAQLAVWSMPSSSGGRPGQHAQSSAGDGVGRRGDGASA